MRSSAKWIAIASCLALAGCQPAPMATDYSPDAVGIAPPADVVGVVDADELQAAGLQVYWQSPRLVLSDGEKVARLYRLNEMLYCLTDHNTLIAVSARVGLTQWPYSVAPPEQTVFAPLHVDDVALPSDVLGIEAITDPGSVPAVVPFNAVIINTLSYVVVLDRKNGRVVRGPQDVRFNFAANTGGASNGVMFFVGGINGRFYGMDLLTGVESWQEGTGKLLTASLRYDDGKLYVGGEDGVFGAWKIAAKHEFAWKRAVEGPISADFYVGNNQCFVPCEDRRLYAISSLDGTNVWPPFITAGELRTPVQVSDATVFQYAHGDSLYAVNRLTGREQWNMPDGRTILAVMEGKAYVLDKDKMMHVVDELTGEVSATVDMSGLDLLLANTSTPGIYGATRDGDVFCFRLISAGHLTPAMLEEEIPLR